MADFSSTKALLMIFTSRSNCSDPINTFRYNKIVLVVEGKKNCSYKHVCKLYSIYSPIIIYILCPNINICPPFQSTYTVDTQMYVLQRYNGDGPRVPPATLQVLPPMPSILRLSYSP